MQARINNRTEIISRVTNHIMRMDTIIFSYIFGSFPRGETFSDLDIGIYLKRDIDRSPLEIEFKLGDFLNKSILKYINKGKDVEL